MQDDGSCENTRGCMDVSALNYSEENDISVIKKDISLLEKQVSDAEIDFIYLSSPEKIKKNITELNKEKYLNFDHSRVFYSINHFLNHNLKETRYLNKKVRE